MAKALQIARKDEDEPFVPRIRRLLEVADLRGARSLLAEARRSRASEPDLDRLEKLLAPPSPRSIPFRDRDRTAEIQWLKEHAREYRGQWVALLGSELLGHGTDFRSLMRHLDAVDPEHAAILHFVELAQEDEAGVSSSRNGAGSWNMAKALQIARKDEDEPFVPRIRRLIEEGRIRQARELVKEAMLVNPSEPGLAHWNEVLSPAVVKAVPGLDVDRSADFRWLQEHGDSYMDQWVAVLEGSLVAHAPTLRELRSILNEKAPGAPVLLHRFH